MQNVMAESTQDQAKDKPLPRTATVAIWCVSILAGVVALAIGAVVCIYLFALGFLLLVYLIKFLFILWLFIWPAVWVVVQILFWFTFILLAAITIRWWGPHVLLGIPLAIGLFVAVAIVLTLVALTIPFWPILIPLGILAFFAL